MAEARPLAGRKIGLRGLLGVAVLLAALFIPAGTIRWTQAWVFLSLYLSAVAGFFLRTKKRDPGLLKERMSPQKNAKAWDRKILRVYTLFLAALPVVAGLDAVRFRWSHFPLWLNIVGFVGLVLSNFLAFWATKENTFASSVVRIQDDRGHRVCTTGPYALIRHPMYAAVIPMAVCLPLALGSGYAFIPAAVIVGLFILRTALEDKTLLEELPGYKDYARKVRFRLIPGVW